MKHVEMIGRLIWLCIIFFNVVGEVETEQDWNLTCQSGVANGYDTVYGTAVICQIQHCVGDSCSNNDIVSMISAVAKNIEELSLSLQFVNVGSITNFQILSVLSQLRTGKYGNIIKSLAIQTTLPGETELVVPPMKWEPFNLKQLRIEGPDVATVYKSLLGTNLLNLAGLENLMFNCSDSREETRNSRRFNFADFKSGVALQKIILAHVDMVGDAKHFYKEHTNLSSLGIRSEHWAGPIPPEWGLFTRLRHLYIQSSSLTGVIPNTFAGLRNMERLHIVGGNFDAQPMPSFVWNRMPMLKSLNLAGSNINGTLPTVFNSSGPAMLVQMNISSNQLAGPLPVEVAKVESLDISNNMFNGNFSLFYDESLASEQGLAVANRSVHVSSNQFSSFAMVPYPPPSSLPAQPVGFSFNGRINNVNDDDLPSFMGSSGKLVTENGQIDLSNNPWICTCAAFKQWMLFQSIVGYVSTSQGCQQVTSASPWGAVQSLDTFVGGPCTIGKPVPTITQTSQMNTGSTQIVVVGFSAPILNEAAGNETILTLVRSAADNNPNIPQDVNDCSKLLSLYGKNGLPSFWGNTSIFMVWANEVESSSSSIGGGGNGVPSEIGACKIIPYRPNVGNFSESIVLPRAEQKSLWNVYVSAATLSNSSITGPSSTILHDIHGQANVQVQALANVEVHQVSTSGLVLMVTESSEEVTRSFGYFGSAPMSADPSPSSQDASDAVVNVVINGNVTTVTRGELKKTNNQLVIEDYLPATESGDNTLKTYNVSVYSTGGGSAYSLAASKPALVYNTMYNVQQTNKLNNCPAGTGVIASNGTGTTNGTTDKDCVPCVVGRYSVGNTVVCPSCGTGKTTLGNGSKSEKECMIAAAGYLLSSPGHVQPCTDELDCTNSGETIESVKLNPGFWRTNNHSLEVYQCPTEEYCNASMQPPGLGGCSSNHKGLMCLECMDGYGFANVGEMVPECTECTDKLITKDRVVVTVWIVFFLVLVVLPWLRAVVFLIRLRLKKQPTPDDQEKGSDTSPVLETTTKRSFRSRAWFLYLENCVWTKVRVFIGFVQVYVCFAKYFKVDFPLSPASHHGLLSVSCIFKQNHYTELVTWTLPVLLVAGSIFLSMYCFSTRCIFGNIGNQLKVEGWNMIFLIGFIVYPMVSILVFGTFVCQDIGSHSFLKTDLTLSCSSRNYRYMLVYAIVMFLIFSIGTVAIYVIYLFRYRAVLRLESLNDAAKQQIRTLKFAYFPYTNKAYWFEAYDLVRKLIQVCGLVLLSPAVETVDSGHSGVSANFPQVLFALFVCICALFLLQLIQPYRNRFDSAFASLSLACLGAICIIVLVESNKTSDTTTSYVWIIGSILILEAVLLVVLSIYDIYHLGQYPDREDEMRVKMKRNFYHSVEHDKGLDVDVETPISVQPSLAPMSLRFVVPSIVDGEEEGYASEDESSGDEYYESEDSMNACVVVDTSATDVVQASDDKFYDPVSTPKTLIIDDLQFTAFGFSEVGATTWFPSDQSISKTQVAKFGTIGQGASGTVHAALHIPTFDIIAIKEISILDDSNKHQAVREIISSSKNDMIHPRSVESKCPEFVQMWNVYFDTDTRSLCLAMEFMNGGTLQDSIDDDEGVKQKMALGLSEVDLKQETMLSTTAAKQNGESVQPGCTLPDVTTGVCNEAMLACIAKDILKALQKLHGNGYVHLDIKPANVLVNTDGNAKLADFGLTQKLSEYQEHARTKFVGTLKYMSPERLRGEPASFASDIWSFGLTILACTLGHYPLEFDSDQEQLDLWLLLERMTNGEGLVVPEIASVRQGSIITHNVAFSEDFRDFIRETLNVNEAKRWTAGELLQHPWVKKYENTNMCTISGDSRPVAFDKSCVVLERIATALMQKIKRQGVGEDEDDVWMDYNITNEQVENLSERLGLAKEIVKYSLLVSGEASFIKVFFV